MLFLVNQLFKIYFKVNAVRALRLFVGSAFRLSSQTALLFTVSQPPGQAVSPPHPPLRT